jgi:hypothetical protein
MRRSALALWAGSDGDEQREAAAKDEAGRAAWTRGAPGERRAGLGPWARRRGGSVRSGHGARCARRGAREGERPLPGWTLPSHAVRTLMVDGAPRADALCRGGTGEPGDTGGPSVAEALVRRGDDLPK